MKIYISHGAMRSNDPDDVNWFVVKPQGIDQDMNKTLMSLLGAGRTVLQLDIPADPSAAICSQIKLVP
jgi:hypothetical protein